MQDRFNLTNLLSPNGVPPAVWQCPLQEGIPIFLNIAQGILIWVALAAFLIGVLLSVFYYVTAFGNEERARKGKETLKWTIIGAIVVMLSAFVIGAFANALLKEPVQIVNENGELITRDSTETRCKTDQQSTDKTLDEVDPQLDLKAPLSGVR